VETGTKISGFIHLGAIGLAVFGGVLFRAPVSEAIQISEVSIITSEDFAVLQSTAPDTSPDVAKAPEIKVPEPVQEVAPAVELPAEPAEPVPDEQLAMIAPEPTPALRIDTQSAQKPDINAKEADATQKEAVPDEVATETAEPVQEQAPKEAATEIVTEAEKPSEYAPSFSNVPRSRPRDMAERVARVNAPNPVEQPTVDNIEDEIAKAMAEADAAQNKPAVPKGPPLTGGEREGLVLAVERFWNVPIGIQNAADMIVVIAIELSPNGKLIGEPKLVDPKDLSAQGMRQAFEAGRRALIRAQPYDLPPEKYEQWRQIEVVFNPEEMAVR
jgi:hypothetical protein